MLLDCLGGIVNLADNPVVSWSYWFEWDYDMVVPNLFLNKARDIPELIGKVASGNDRTSVECLSLSC